MVEKVEDMSVEEETLGGTCGAREGDFAFAVGKGNGGDACGWG